MPGPAPTPPEDSPRTEPPFDPQSWGGALIVMGVVAAVIWVVQLISSSDHNRLDRFGIKPREIDGLWGLLTMPFLHASFGHLLANTIPLVLIGWVLLLSGLRVWLIVTALVVL